MKHFNFKSRMLPCSAFAAAIALVVSFSSFTGAAKTVGADELLTFEYNPPSNDPDPYSKENVENVANWEYQDQPGTCNLGDEQPCQIYVPNNSTYVGAGNTLKSAINIQAETQGSSTDAHVIATAEGDQSENFLNRAE